MFLMQIHYIRLAQQKFVQISEQLLCKAEKCKLKLIFKLNLRGSYWLEVLTRIKSMQHAGFYK